MQWTKDKYGHIVTSIVKDEKRYVAKVYANGVYHISALSFVDKPRIPESVETALSGVESSVKEAMKVCEGFLGEVFRREDAVEIISTEDVEPVSQEVIEPVVETIEEPATVEEETVEPEAVEEVAEPEVVEEPEVAEEVKQVLEIKYIDGKVSIIAQEGAVIHYTTTGKEPKATNKVYKDEFEAEKGTVIKAKAWYEDDTTSEVVEFTVE